MGPRRCHFESGAETTTVQFGAAARTGRDQRVHAREAW